MTTYQADGGEELLVHDWRVDRLTRLGVPGSLAEVYAVSDSRGSHHGPFGSKSLFPERTVVLRPRASDRRRDRRVNRPGKDLAECGGERGPGLTAPGRGSPGDEPVRTDQDR